MRRKAGVHRCGDSHAVGGCGRWMRSSEAARLDKRRNRCIAHVIIPYPVFGSTKFHLNFEFAVGEIAVLQYTRGYAAYLIT